MSGELRPLFADVLWISGIISDRSCNQQNRGTAFADGKRSASTSFPAERSAVCASLPLGTFNSLAEVPAAHAGDIGSCGEEDA
jgi:hypothetical protein